MDEQFIVLMDFSGTAIFTLTGAIKGIAHRLDMLGVVILGSTVGIGGGVLCDLLVCTPPPILRCDFYATASLIGVFLLRIIAFHRHIRLPK